jgi:predicted PurR-regulated permease PerM
MSNADSRKNDKKTTVLSIPIGTIVKVVISALCVYALYILSDLLLILITAGVLATVMEPLIRWFVKKANIIRPLAAAIAYIAVIGGIGLLCYFLVPPLLGETLNAIGSLPKTLKTNDILSSFQNETIRGAKIIFPDIPTSIALGDVANYVMNALSSLSGGVLDSFSGLLRVMFSFVLTLVIAFYLSVSDDGVGEALSVFTPKKHEAYVRRIWRRSQNKIGRWMQGQMVLALCVGALTYGGLIAINIVFDAHVQHPLLLAALAALFEFIPIIGMWIAAIPAFLLAFLDGGLGLGLLVLGLYVLIQQIEAHVVYPLVVKKVVGVPPLLVVVSLVAGAELFGVVGALLAVPLSVGLMEYLADKEKAEELELEREHVANQLDIQKETKEQDYTKGIEMPMTEQVSDIAKSPALAEMKMHKDMSVEMQIQEDSIEKDNISS